MNNRKSISGMTKKEIEELFTGCNTMMQFKDGTYSLVLCSKTGRLFEVFFGRILDMEFPIDELVNN